MTSSFLTHWLALCVGVGIGFVAGALLSANNPGGR